MPPPLLFSWSDCGTQNFGVAAEGSFCAPVVQQRSAALLRQDNRRCSAIVAPTGVVITIPSNPPPNSGSAISIRHSDSHYTLAKCNKSPPDFYTDPLWWREVAVGWPSGERGVTRQVVSPVQPRRDC